MILNKSIYLKVPELEELSQTEHLLQDSKTIKFNKKSNGTTKFSKEDWEAYLTKNNTDTAREYFHIYNLDNQFVGDITSVFDYDLNSHVVNVKIMYYYRRNNHAYDALEAFLDIFFSNKSSIKISYNVALDNVAAINLMTKMGFVDKKITNEYALYELNKLDY